MSDAQVIANEIIKQLKAFDFWALARWGAKDYRSMSDNGDRRGGLQFKCSGSKVVRGGYASIELMPSDTYTVKVVKIIGEKMTVLGECQGVYFDGLVEVLEEMIG